MAAMATMAETEALAAGDRALHEGDLDAATAHYTAAGEHPAALDGLSWVAWWRGDVPALFDRRERAYRAHRAADDPIGAARAAVWLASAFVDARGEVAVARGWLAQARALLEGQEPSDALGWLGLVEADLALSGERDLDGARARGQAVLVLAEQLGQPDLRTVALAIVGAAEVAAGDVDAGLRRLDEAAGVAVSQAYDHAMAPGWALCYTIGCCTRVGDLPRASQWCHTLSAFTERWAGCLFFGTCRSSYGAILAAQGEWGQAGDTLEQAVETLQRSSPAMAAGGKVRLGDLRARQGRKDEARALFDAAAPHPGAILGLGRLALDAGDAVSAAEAAERVLRRTAADDLLSRVDPLELLVVARAAAGDAAGAGAACEQLGQATDTLGTPYLVARGALTCAVAAAAGGELDRARRSAEDAADAFAACAAPYDAARARAVLADVLAREGRTEAAAQELAAARTTFTALGAHRDVQRTGSAVLTHRELEVLKLVAAGCSDAQVAERLVVSPHTVHRHVANVRTKLGAPSRAAAVAWAAEHGLL